MRALRTTRAAAQPQGALLVQRCSCGSEGKSASGTCEECREKEAPGLQAKLVVGAAGDAYEREADRAAEAVTADRGASVAEGSPVTTVLRRTGPAAAGAGQVAPPSVSRTISRSGEPLGRSARAYFEPRFGHDFGNVRVHRDAEAAASARDVAARAYTVGNHVVFGAGRYAPESRGGRSLIAHELAHVIQQTGTVRRASISPEPAGRGGENDEEEELQLSTGVEESEGEAGIGVVQREPLEKGQADAAETEPAEQKEGEEKGEDEAERKKIEECMENTPPDPAECEPDRPLTWADFPGTPSGSFTAKTFSDVRKRATNTALLKCNPQDPSAADANAAGAQGFLMSRSWVRSKFANPTDNDKNGCRTSIDACESTFDNGGTYYSMPAGTPSSCPAGTPYRGDEAKERSECETKVGKDCKDQIIAESARLLKHEQAHFDLTCAMARKANGMITKTTDVDALVKAAEKVKRKQQKKYDDDTNHGCKAAEQATWEADIAAGLPKVTIRVK